MKLLCKQCKREYESRFETEICPDCWNDVENKGIELNEAVD